MQNLIESVKSLALTANKATCKRSFLNSTISDPCCQHLVTRMCEITPDTLAIQGQNDPYHFSNNLNRVTIACSDDNDYRLVLFFIKKGTVMPLHDHPNMSVFFRLVTGNLLYKAYDKVDDKHKYNDFASQEYDEFLAKKAKIKAKKSRLMNIKAGDLLYVRPSTNNMHQFVAQENSCFFDICLPNYCPEGHTRKVTYFKEIG